MATDLDYQVEQTAGAECPCRCHGFGVDSFYHHPSTNGNCPVCHSTGRACQSLKERRMTVVKFFLTVDWCSLGNRGIFCDSQGEAFSKDSEHTENEIWEILDCFSFVLSPKSLQLTEEEVSEYTTWIPLAEFSDEFGVALRKEQHG